MSRILIFLIAALISLPALAQGEGSPETQTYDPSGSGANQTGEYIRGLQAKSQVDKGFIKPQTVHVSIVHQPYMDADQFGLQMAVPDVESGCYQLTPLEYEANFIDPYFLDIKVKRYRRIAPEGAASAAQCDRGNKMSTAMMVLSKRDLMSRGTKEIRFSTEAAIDTYKININETTLQLVPESMVVFKPSEFGGELKDRIVYNFAADNVVALHVPMAQPGDDVGNELLKFAAMNALSPTNNAPGRSGTGAPILYFNDQSGGIQSQIGPDGYGEVGTITVARPYDGAQGRVWTPVTLSVFVTRPGTQL